MKQYIIKDLAITTVILIYLYVCGGLYLVSFWHTFDIKLMELVSFSEISKSFIVPFIYASFGLFAFVVLNEYFEKIGNRDIIIYEKLKRIFYKIPFVLTTDFWIALILIIAYKLRGEFSHTSTYWKLCIGSLVFFVMIKAVNFSPIVKLIPNRHHRDMIMTFIIIFPAFCVLQGKIQSNIIYNNTKYANIKIRNSKIPGNNDSISFKFLGYLGDKLIIISLNNQTIKVLNYSDLDEVEITNTPK